MMELTKMGFTRKTNTVKCKYIVVVADALGKTLYSDRIEAESPADALRQASYNASVEEVKEAAKNI